MNSKPKAMTIGEIRHIIDSAFWARDWYTGGTSEEFRKQKVGPELQKHIDALTAIQPKIKERFARDRQLCARAIESLAETVKRWESVQQVAA